MRRRFTISSLMALVVLVGVGLAALKNPTEPVASCVVTLTVGSLLFGLVKAIAGRGDERRTWWAFGLCGTGYFLLSFFDGLPTGLILDHLSQIIFPDSEVRKSGEDLIQHICFCQIGHSFFALLAGLLGSIFAHFFASKRPQNRRV